MEKRYFLDQKQKVSNVASIYTSAEIGLDLRRIDKDAYNAIETLQRAGFEAYIVGGAIRDLLCGLTPKDFDLVTGAQPKKIRTLFRNARIIGKRFRLVHLFYGRKKIIEVATFRAQKGVEELHSKSNNNIFGTLLEDFSRRDFSVNALYFDPVNDELIDFVGAYEDIQKKQFHSVVPLKYTFKEDPVRMVRAIKYSVIGGLTIPSAMGRQIRREAHLLKEVSTSRISEEINKIFHSGKSAAIFSQLLKFKLLHSLMPPLCVWIEKKTLSSAEFFGALEKLDSLCEKEREMSEEERSNPLSLFLSPILDKMISGAVVGREKSFYYETILELKEFLHPYIPPNEKIERGLSDYYRSHGGTPPPLSLKNWRRNRKRELDGRANDTQANL